MELRGDLALELQIAFAASDALAIAENPDVLFVIAAGNKTEFRFQGVAERLGE